MSSSNDVSFVHNSSFKYDMNSSSNMNILIPMHIICLQKYSVQTVFIDIALKKLNVFPVERVNLSTSQALYTKNCIRHNILSWYPIIIRHKMIIGLFIRIKILAFNKSDHKIIKYNNAKRSIPAHPTFVNDTHRDLHLWTVTSKITGVYHG